MPFAFTADGYAIAIQVRAQKTPELIPPYSSKRAGGSHLRLGDGTLIDLINRKPGLRVDFEFSPEGCPHCYGSGLVVVDAPRSEDDHSLDRAACLCRAGVLLAAAVREQLFRPDPDFPFDGPPEGA